MTTPPREPEIEVLAHLATGTLRVLRAAFWLAGAIGIGFGLHRSCSEGGLSFYAPYSALTVPSAIGVVWICGGIPLVARAEWLFGRGRHRWWLLVLCAALWIGASWLPGDPEYGYVLRFFASLVATLTMLVWRTLWRLTPTGAAGR